MIELTKHPKPIGMTLEGRLVPDLDPDVNLPFPTEELVPVTFTGVSVLEVTTEMAAMKVRFEAEQAVNSLNPGVWENVGYVDESDTLGTITAYYQIGFPQKGIVLEPQQTPRFDRESTYPLPQTRPSNGSWLPFGHRPWTGL